MRIIIAGAGKVGMTLGRQLSEEGHDITLIDIDSLVLEESIEQFDAVLQKHLDKTITFSAPQICGAGFLFPVAIFSVDSRRILLYNYSMFV